MLKLAFFTSDRSSIYISAIDPFVNAVNAAGRGVVSIEVYAGGTLGRNPVDQLQLVLDGTADIAFIIPGYTPERFPDDGVIELPGLFQNDREASLTFARLIEAGALRGYEDLVVIGPFAAAPGSVHLRGAATSLDDLTGQRVRVNNPVEGAAVTSLGMVPVPTPLSQVSNAISAGTLDGAVAPPAPLMEFGISRVVTNHFLLGISSAPLPVVMNRRSFEALSPDARAIISAFSGEWLLDRYLTTTEAADAQAIEALSADPRRHVTEPSAADRERALAAFAEVTAGWLAADPSRAELLALAESELQAVRADP